MGGRTQSHSRSMHQGLELSVESRIICGHNIRHLSCMDLELIGVQQCYIYISIATRNLIGELHTQRI